MQALESRVKELSAEMEEKVAAMSAQQAEHEGMRRQLEESMAEVATLNENLTSATDAFGIAAQVLCNTYHRNAWCMTDACPCSACQVDTLCLSQEYVSTLFLGNATMLGTAISQSLSDRCHCHLSHSQ